MNKARLTWREHTSRLTGDLLYEYLALNLVMGDLIDKERTVWEESFIPMEFQSVIRNVTIVFKDGVGYDSQKLLAAVNGLVGIR